MVFSGIVEEIGTVVAYDASARTQLWDGSYGEGVTMTVKAPKVICTPESALYVGCSIAINGVCLTATALHEDTCTFGLAPETLRRSNLGGLRVGDAVNVERSLPAGARNSGHFVQGHVDCTGTIIEKWLEGDSLWVRVSAPASLHAFLVPKGYVAVDGTSLTVCDVAPPAGDAFSFTFMLIEFTQKHIIIPHKPVGGAVNLEADVMGKYAARATDALRLELHALHERVRQLEAAAASAAAPASTSAS